MNNLRFASAAVAITFALAISIQSVSAQRNEARNPRENVAAMKAITSAKPFQTNNGLKVPPDKYKGPVFKLSSGWPQHSLGPITNAPWQEAIHGQITPENAGAYVEALKKFVSANAEKLIFEYGSWDASKAKWYNEPWLGSLRETIHGTYCAGEFPPQTFPGTGLRATFATHVLTYYDERAAYTLYKLWGTSAMKPDVTTANSQFEEGAVVIKLALFASEDPKLQKNWWDAMEGAAEWPLYTETVSEKNCDLPTSVAVVPTYLAQFDIIVKDSKAAPRTGWVFSTLVYDKDAPGKDAWDKMVALGAMWGNDPDVTVPGKPLHENWINPKAPKYSTQTLGWGGRLSGPNDGAMNDIAYDGKTVNNAPDSSCMSCHGPAEWDVQKHKMVSFILPSYPNTFPPPPSFLPCGNDGKPNKDGDFICSPSPASSDWMRWFQSRPGTEPQDAGSVALDYDDVAAFKALRLWWAAVRPPGGPAIDLLLPSHAHKYNQYTGAPIHNPDDK